MSHEKPTPAPTPAPEKPPLERTADLMRRVLQARKPKVVTPKRKRSH